jgi:hypothetical protein
VAPQIQPSAHGDGGAQLEGDLLGIATKGRHLSKDENSWILRVRIL